MTIETKAEAVGGDGVDTSLIRWMLSLTPAERLDVLDRHVADVQRLREVNRGAWDSKHSSSD